MVYRQILGLALTVLLQALGETWSQYVPQSPCPDVFEYKVDPAGMWYGLISVPPPEPDFNIKLTVEMSINIILPSKYAGKIQLVENKNEVWRRIITGDRQPVQYQLYFPLSWPLPTIMRIILNNNVVCLSGPTPVMLTKISVEHSLYPIRLNLFSPQNKNTNNQLVPSNPVNNVPLVEQTTEFVPFPPFRPTTTSAQPDAVYTRPPVTARPVYPNEPQNPIAAFECGISLKAKLPLVINGDPTERGEWPWLVAMYIKSALPGLQFRCGGSLLSQNVVLTAAHCIKYKGKPEIKAESIILYMGKFNLEQWTERDNQPRDVEQVHLHPDYKSDDAADIAVMILKDKVDYTLYVRPICIWDFSDDINLIVGQSGTVVGWGQDETGSLSSEPRKVTMPIVSQEQCLLSKIEFVFYTSNRTFCAGSRNGSGPCSGDSGGGFMISYSDGDRLKWYLRGVVHMSLYDREAQQCDVKSYFIFTDVAKYMNWIREFV